MAVVSTGSVAQNTDKKKELTKEITLEKDFVPVERKVVKRNALPVVKKTAAPTRSSLSLSDVAVPTQLPTGVPTMMPYGYRTAHLFDDSKGYVAGALGSQVNVAVSAGYRIVDNITTRLGVWVQHNSTWGGKNSTQMPGVAHATQKFNDNKLGIDFANRFSVGTLSLGAMAHLDRFNYMGNISTEIDDITQSFHNLGFNAAWRGDAALKSNDFAYNVGVSYFHSGYGKGEIALPTEKPIVASGDVHEHNLRFDIGAKYDLGGYSAVGADLALNVVRMSADNSIEAPPFVLNRDYNFKRNVTQFSLNPYYAYNRGNLNARLGAKLMIFGGTAGSKFKFAPDVNLDVKVADGFAIFAAATGDARLNTINDMHELNRYSVALAQYPVTFTPLDITAGVKIGEFKGFTFKVFGGYTVSENALLLADESSPLSFMFGVSYPNLTTGGGVVEMAKARYTARDSRGLKVGGELDFTYGNIVDFNAKFTFAPQKNEFATDGDYKALLLGVDAPKMVGEINLGVKPIKGLKVEVGCDMRTGRRYASYLAVDKEGTVAMNDVINLRAGANYRFDRNINLWVQASNLLGRKWDISPGIGAQKLGIMAGAGFTF